MSGEPSKNYGAVEQPQPDEEAYDIDNVYYVKEREVSAAEKRRKFLLVALPILIALLLVGGFTYYLLSGAHILKPEGAGGSGGEIKTSPTIISPSSPSKSSGRVSTPAPKEKTKSSASSGPTTCDANEKCANLGLSGDCCPTKAGVMLNCCT